MCIVISIQIRRVKIPRGGGGIMNSIQFRRVKIPEGGGGGGQGHGGTKFPRGGEPHLNEALIHELTYCSCMHSLA